MDFIDEAGFTYSSEWGAGYGELTRFIDRTFTPKFKKGDKVKIVNGNYLSDPRFKPYAKVFSEGYNGTTAIETIDGKGFQVVFTKDLVKFKNKKSMKELIGAD